VTDASAPKQHLNVNFLLEGTNEQEIVDKGRDHSTTYFLLSSVARHREEISKRARLELILIYV
jgi:hypothetical protein